jgi:hypothetical protein
MEHMASVMTQLGQKMQQAETNEHIANGIAEYNQIVNGFEEEMVNLDPSKYSETFEKRLTSVSKIYKGKNAQATETLKNKITVWNEAARADVMRRSIRDYSAKVRATMPEHLKNFAINGQDDEAMELIEGYKGSVLHEWEVAVAKKEYLKIKQEVIEQEAINNAYGDIIADPLAAKDNLTADNWQEIYPGLENKDRLSLIKEARREQANKINQQNIIHAKQVEETSQAFVDKFTQDSLTEKDITDSVLSADDKEHWIDKVRKRSDDIINGKTDPLTQTDAAVKSQLIVRANASPGSVSVTELAKLVGDGITADDMTDIMNLQNKRLKEMPTSNNTLSKKWIGSVEDMYTNGFFGDKDEPGTQIKRNQALTKMSKWFEENPDATDSQAEEFFKTVTDGHGKWWWAKKVFTKQNITTPPLIAPTLFTERIGRFVGQKMVGNKKQPPSEYPDAIWDEDEMAWTVIRDGQRYKVEE